MLSYCPFPCISLTEARNRGIKGKPGMPSSVILLPLISEGNRSPVRSGPADWALHTAPSQWNLDETALKCEGASSPSMCWTWCQSQPNHQPISGSISCPACVAPALVTAREDGITPLVANAWLRAAEEPPLALCSSNIDSGTEPRNTSQTMESFSD